MCLRFWGDLIELIFCLLLLRCAGREGLKTYLGYMVSIRDVIANECDLKEPINSIKVDITTDSSNLLFKKPNSPLQS